MTAMIVACKDIRKGIGRWSVASKCSSCRQGCYALHTTWRAWEVSSFEACVMATFYEIIIYFLLIDVVEI